jgi:hypothetical protein
MKTNIAILVAAVCLLIVGLHATGNNTTPLLAECHVNTAC